MTYGNRPFGLDNVKLTNIGGTTQVALAAEQKLTFKPVYTSDELRGKNGVVEVVSVLSHYEWELESGGVPLDAYNIMTGQTVTEAGTTPNQTNTMAGSKGDRMPYFKIYGQSLGAGDDDIHAKLFKCKVTEGPEGEYSDGKFFVSKLKGLALDDGTNGIMEVVQNETSTDLPSS